MGTPAFAVPVLDALLEAGHEVAAAYSRPDRPSGRDKRTTPTPVKAAAAARGLRVRQPPSLKSRPVHDEIAALAPEVIVVAAYGLILPKAVLDLPDYSCLNVHPSLLPRFRGPSPVASAIVEGETTTGVTIMQIDEGVDSGPVVAQRETRIEEDETAEVLTSRLFELGAELLVDVLPDWAAGRVEARPQDESQATTTRLLTREDGRIDWTMSADWVARQVRGYTPWPGAYTYWGGKVLKVLGACSGGLPSGGRPPGTVIETARGDRLGVVTGDGVLTVSRLQVEGRRPAAAGDFVRGHRAILGAVLGS